MRLGRILRAAPVSAKIGMAVLALNLAAVLLAPWIAPYGQTQVVADTWIPGFWDPSAMPHGFYLLLGSDHLGRDVFTRLLYGARNSISVALLTTALSFCTGVLLGLLAATRRGIVDQGLSRLVDIVMGFPSLIFALMLLTVLGSSIPVLIGVIAVLDMTRVFRITRAVAVDLEAQDFVEVAVLRGEGAGWIMGREILPNAIAPLTAEFGVRFCFVFLFIASLSFIGLGLQPPMADWGSMVRENAAAISYGILIPLFPAAAIAQLTVATNLVVDWVASGPDGGRSGR
jgi:peptide/nickel transport system permease protein